MVLHAYVDDSKKALGRKTLFLAGYVNAHDKWTSFNRRWAEVLQDGRPIPYLHMVDLHAARGEFRGWGRLDREIKVAAHANVIAEFEPTSFHVSLDLDDFHRIFDKSLPFGFQSPYFVCFIAVVTQIGRHAERFFDQSPVTITFDEQKQIQRPAIALYKGLKAMQPDEQRSWMGDTPSFESDKHNPALQAADMLAWHIQREFRDGDLKTTRRATKLLIKDGRHSYLCIDRAALHRMREQILQLPNLVSLTDKRIWKSVIKEIEDARIRKEHDQSTRLE